MTTFWKLIYRLILQPLVMQLIKQQAKKKPNLKEALEGRTGIWERMDEALQKRDWNLPLLWLHAASAGEILQAEPILRQFEKENVQLALSYTSVNAKRWLESGSTKLPNSVIWKDYLPIDSHFNALRILAKLQPNALVYVSYDLWPNLVWEAQRKGVTQFLVSALVHQGSWRHSNLIGRSLFSTIYQAMQEVAAISAGDTQRILESYPKSIIRVLGDTRVDSVLSRRDGVTSPDFPETWNKAKVFIGGSIWPADLACLRSVLLDALEELPELRLILVPHEPTEQHISEIKEIFSRHPIHLWSQGQKEEFAKARVLIVDAIGVLYSLYAKANLAFVGGAFTTGVHNIMEPVAFGLPTFFGPQFHNYSTAIRFVEDKLAYSVRNAEELRSLIMPLLKEPDKAKELGLQAQNLLEQEAGAAQQCAEFIRPVLMNSENP
ncbi:MAG: glycosyltransferase N-terminal domain-containing protein [SAR324 cluster bacterium]|nr:glycosyltransferase N-terminal domain-containing protein [SAR324 cluster bacterium]